MVAKSDKRSLFILDDIYHKNVLCRKNLGIRENLTEQQVSNYSLGGY